MWAWDENVALPYLKTYLETIPLCVGCGNATTRFQFSKVKAAHCVQEWTDRVKSGLIHFAAGSICVDEPVKMNIRPVFRLLLSALCLSWVAAFNYNVNYPRAVYRSRTNSSFGYSIAFHEYGGKTA